MSTADYRTLITSSNWFGSDDLYYSFKSADVIVRNIPDDFGNTKRLYLKINGKNCAT